MLITIVFNLAMLIISPFISIFTSFIFMVLNRTNAKTSLLFFATSVSIIFLRYYTDGYDDSSAHYMNIRFFTEYYTDFFEFFSALINNELRYTAYNYTQYPLFGIFLYFISRTEIAALSSVISSFFVYYFVLYPLADLYQKLKLSRLWFTLFSLAMFLMVSNRFLVSGMRYNLVMAGSLLVLYLFTEGRLNNFKFIISSIALITIHTAAIQFLVFALFLKKFKIRSIIQTLVIFFTTGIVSEILPKIFENNRIFFFEVIRNKIIGYIAEGAYEFLFTTTVYMKMYVVTAAMIIFILITFILSKHIQEYKYFSNYVYMYAIFTFGSVFYNNLWDRNIQYLGFLLILSLAMYKVEFEGRSEKLELIILVVLGVFIAFNMLYNYNYSNFYYVDYEIWEFLISNIFDYFRDVPYKI